MNTIIVAGLIHRNGVKVTNKTEQLMVTEPFKKKMCFWIFFNLGQYLAMKRR